MIFPGRSLPLQSRQFIESRGSRAGAVQDILIQEFHSVLMLMLREEYRVFESFEENAAQK